MENGFQLVMSLDCGVNIPEDDPVRLLNAVMERMDYRRIYAAYSREGRIEYSPKILTKILVYGYAGFKSSTVLRIDEWIDSNGLHLKKYNRLNPLWQANYYDHIIRNEKEYKNIEQYIEANPSNWGSDTLNGIPVQPNNSIM